MPVKSRNPVRSRLLTVLKVRSGAILQIWKRIEPKKTIKATRQCCQVACPNQPNNHHTNPILTLRYYRCTSASVQTEEKSQIPSSKFQRSSKSKSQSPRIVGRGFWEFGILWGFGAWGLRFPCCLDLGVWIFDRNFANDNQPRRIVLVVTGENHYVTVR